MDPIFYFIKINVAFQNEMKCCLISNKTYLDKNYKFAQENTIPPIESTNINSKVRAFILLENEENDFVSESRKQYLTVTILKLHIILSLEVTQP